MALEKTYNKFDTDFTGAYHKVDMFVRLGKEVGLHWSVNIYTDDTKVHLVDSKSYQKDYDPAGGEPLTQAYTHMKTLPEYTGSTDV